MKVYGVVDVHSHFFNIQNQEPEKYEQLKNNKFLSVEWYYLIRFPNTLKFS
jgi:hypothetical protein